MTKKKSPRRRASPERPTRSGKRLRARSVRAGKRVDKLGALLEAEIKARRISRKRARAMRRVAELIREVVALEKRDGGKSSVYSVQRLPAARSRRAGGAKRRSR
jgi:hypothetical protein